MTRQMSLRLPDRLAQKLNGHAKREGVDRSSLVRHVLETYFEETAGEEKSIPYQRVADLIGSLRGGPPDLGRRHRDYLRERFRGR